jgi:hypothetical protein
MSDSLYGLVTAKQLILSGRAKLTIHEPSIPLISPRADRREDLASKLESIALDLRGLNRPTPILPTSSIGLSHWFLSATPVLTISGVAHDHPKLGNKTIATSQVFYINTEIGLVRTLNRWYRLGMPMESTPSSSEH